MDVKYRIVTNVGREFWTTVGGVLPEMHDGEEVLVIQRHGPGDLDADERLTPELAQAMIAVKKLVTGEDDDQPILPVDDDGNEIFAPSFSMWTSRRSASRSA